MFFGKQPFLAYDGEKVEIEFKSLQTTNEKFEQYLKKEMTKYLKQHPWSEWLLSIKGIGAGIAASIIGELDGAIFGSIEKGKKITHGDFKGFGRKFPSVAHLWSFAGYSVEDGKAVRRKIGETASWNNYLKLTCYKFAESMIKSRGTYRELYDKRKKFEKRSHPIKIASEKKDKNGRKIFLYTPKHIEARTKRYMIKKFLSDVYHRFIAKDFETNPAV